jgi:hypothetical protein
LEVDSVQRANRSIVLFQRFDSNGFFHRNPPQMLTLT